MLIKLTRKFSFLILVGLVGQIAIAADNANMKHCVEYMRGTNSISPYYPVTDSGVADMKTMSEYMKTSGLKYQAQNGRESINSKWGGAPVKLTVKRDSNGLLQTITTEVTPYPGRPEELINHTFQYVNGKCTPDNRELRVTYPGKSSEIVQSVNLKLCHDLKTFFAKHPDLKKCADPEIQKQLSSILKQRTLQVETSDVAWLVAKSDLDQCEAIPGMNSALNDDALWDSPIQLFKKDLKSGKAQHK